VNQPRSRVFILLLVALAPIVLPAAALAADPQSQSAQSAQGAVGAAQSPFGGTIDVQRGSIDGSVNLDAGSATLKGALSDPGVDGQLAVTVPGQFVGSGTAANGVLSYNLMLCGAGVTFGLRGSSISDLHVLFHDTASDPNACSAQPTSASIGTGLFMQPIEFAAQAEPAPTESGAQALLFNWLRRLVGYALLAGLLVLVIPAMPGAIAVATQSPPWGRVGIGLALALTMPLLGLLLFAVGLPVGLWWLGVLLLALYPVLLVLSMAISGLALGSWAGHHLPVAGVPTWVPLILGLVVLSFISLLPYVGALINVAAIIFGLGTLVLAPRSSLSSRPATVPGGGDLPAPEATSEAAPAPVPATPVAA
jgi:hypothetical protein